MQNLEKGTNCKVFLGVLVTPMHLRWCSLSVFFPIRHTHTHTHTHTHKQGHTHTHRPNHETYWQQRTKQINQEAYLFISQSLNLLTTQACTLVHTHTHHTHTYIHNFASKHTHTHIELIFITIHNHSNERLFSSQDCIYPWIQVKHPCGMDTDIYHYAASIYGSTFCTTLTNGSSDYAAGNSVSVTPSYHKWPPSTDLSFRQWDMMGKGEREKSLTKRRGVRDDVW